MTRTALEAERAHLAGLLETIQRCVYLNILIRYTP
jgi:hypothetical protein